MKSNTPFVTIVFFIIVSLSVGCGGSNNSTDQKSSPAVSTQQDEPKAIPHEKCSVTVSGENKGVKYKFLSESDYTGDIKFNCSHDKNEPTAQQYFLINGVASLNVSKLKRDTKIVSNCKLTNSSYINTISVRFNYNSGIVEMKSDNTATGKSGCTSKFITPLKTTIGKQESIKVLFDTWGTDVSEVNKSKTGLIETDCPQAANDQTPAEIPVCKIIMTDIYTLTDGSGKVHIIEKTLSY